MGRDVWFLLRDVASWINLPNLHGEKLDNFFWTHQSAEITGQPSRPEPRKSRARAGRENREHWRPGGQAARPQQKASSGGLQIAEAWGCTGKSKWSPWGCKYEGVRILLQTFICRNPLGTYRKDIQRSETAFLGVQSWGGEISQQPLWKGREIPPGSFPFFPAVTELSSWERGATLALRLQKKSLSWGRGRNNCQIWNFVLGIPGGAGSLGRQHPWDPGTQVSVCLRLRLNQNSRGWTLTTTTPLTHAPG